MTTIPSEYLTLFAPHMQEPSVDVAACAQEVGLPIFSVDLQDGVSGMLKRVNGDQFECYVDKSEPSVRQRFTAAHELGHFVLHKDSIGATHQDNYRLRAEGMTNWQETQANQFAADLLMPMGLISDAMDSGTTSVSALARLFKVSEIAMSIRLGLPT
ncbi:ImmA/IrrE family metallo-endopeptidase [uncultured Erythrobacter sp.]|uniref:ImmA/IrrE family metallo-endopeptidase n=1 Tax=uncultured Erythrobacter sp. TaxID=263913 RepID=UPI002612FC54|nr:ImmA/IrrE family metallo-endopeptidase [uncultured Erythrobacter sp.]